MSAVQLRWHSGETQAVVFCFLFCFEELTSRVKKREKKKENLSWVVLGITISQFMNDWLSFAVCSSTKPLSKRRTLQQTCSAYHLHPSFRSLIRRLTRISRTYSRAFNENYTERTTLQPSFTSASLKLPVPTYSHASSDRAPVAKRCTRRPSRPIAHPLT